MLNCEFCKSFNLQNYDEQVCCDDCATIQPQYPLSNVISKQTIRNYNSQQKVQKKSYVKGGTQQYLKTEYFNVVKNLKFDEDYVKDVQQMIYEIVDFNEKVIEVCKQIANSFFTVKIQEKMFKRNYFINQNSVLFFVLIHLKKFDILDKLIGKFNYGIDLKLKKLYLKERDKLDLKSVANSKIKFIQNFVDQSSELAEMSDSFFSNQIFD